MFTSCVFIVLFSGFYDHEFEDYYDYVSRRFYVEIKKWAIKASAFACANFSTPGVGTR